MKKVLALSIAMSLVFALSACGSSSSSKSTPSAEKPAENSSSAATSAESAAATSTAETETVSDKVLVDQDGIKITFKGMGEDGILGPKLKLLIENNSEKAISVQVRDVSVNGFMVDALISADVQPGKKNNDSITFLKAKLEENDIKKLETVELKFHIFSSENWETIFDSDTITLEF